MKEKMYESQFKEPLIEDCGFCQTCGSKYNCFKENLAVKCKKMNEAIKQYNKKFMETCPENSKEQGGQCVSKEPPHKPLKNKCPAGYAWDPLARSQGWCVKHTDK